MEQIQKLIDIKKFEVRNEKLVYRNSKGIFDDNVCLIELENDFFGDFYFENNFLIIQNYLGNISIYSGKDLIYDLKGFYNYLNKSFISIKDLETSNFNYLKKGSFTSLQINNNFICFKNYCYYFEGYRIHAFGLTDIEPIWQFSIKDLGTFLNLGNEELFYEVKHFIGIYQNKLIVQLTNASVLILDVNTGNAITTIFLHKEILLSQGLFWDDSIPMHLVEKKLIWLSNQSLIEINLDNFEVKNIKNYFEVSKETQFRFMSNTYFDGKIYFVADVGWQYVTPSHVGVLDAKNGEVLWHTQLKKTGGLAESPQVTHDKLYVRTNNSELYIFSKEGSE